MHSLQTLLFLCSIKRYQRVASSRHLFLFLHSLLHLHLSLPLPHHTVKAALSTIPKDLHCTKSNGPVSVLQFLTSPCCLALLMCSPFLGKCSSFLRSTVCLQFALQFAGLFPDGSSSVFADLIYLPHECFPLWMYWELGSGWHHNISSSSC